MIVLDIVAIYVPHRSMTKDGSSGRGEHRGTSATRSVIVEEMVCVCGGGSSERARVFTASSECHCRWCGHPQASVHTQSMLWTWCVPLRHHTHLSPLSRLSHSHPINSSSAPLSKILFQVNIHTHTHQNTGSISNTSKTFNLRSSQVWIEALPSVEVVQPFVLYQSSCCVVSFCCVASASKERMDLFDF